MRQFFRSAPTRLAFVAFSLFFSLSLLSRLALLVTARHDLTWDASLIGVFACGFVFDVAAGLFAAIPWVLLGVVAPVRFLKCKAGGILIGLMMTIFASALIFITTSEWFFWDEFGARFNFIAVDYLIWTQEVLGNLFESYPMIPILSGIILIGALVAWTMKRKGVFNWAVEGTTTWRDRCGTLATVAVLAFVPGWFVNQSAMPAFTNQYHGELAKNGCWSFMAAFRQMELEYTKWYPKLPHEQAMADAKRLLVTQNETATSAEPDDLQRSIRHKEAGTPLERAAHLHGKPQRRLHGLLGQHRRDHPQSRPPRQRIDLLRKPLCHRHPHGPWHGSAHPQSPAHARSVDHLPPGRNGLVDHVLARS